MHRQWIVGRQGHARTDARNHVHRARGIDVLRKRAHVGNKLEGRVVDGFGDGSHVAARIPADGDYFAVCVRKLATRLRVKKHLSDDKSKSSTRPASVCSFLAISRRITRTL